MKRRYTLSGIHSAILVLESREDNDVSSILNRMKQQRHHHDYADFMLMYLGAVKVQTEIIPRSKGIGPYRTHYECDDETATLIKMFLQ